MMKAIVFLADGFEECEALLVVDVLRRAGIETVMASVMGRKEVDSSRHIAVIADALAEEADFSDTDLIVLPGGRLGIENLWKSEVVKEQCRLFAKNRLIAAICAAPSLLAALNILEGKKATCHPDFEDKMAGALLTHESVTTDGNIITGQGLGATFPFAFTLVKYLVGETSVNRIKGAICYKE
ncbi:MAG: DJ-1/PfpI family protein [Clostridia bacterium]|nr:DJ-1/PfpI family protein [Clostridia bacterium]